MNKIQLCVKNTTVLEAMGRASVTKFPLTEMILKWYIHTTVDY